VNSISRGPEPSQCDTPRGQYNAARLGHAHRAFVTGYGDTSDSENRCPSSLFASVADAALTPLTAALANQPTIDAPTVPTTIRPRSYVSSASRSLSATDANCSSAA
jgi:hypothetical protein